MKVVLETSSYKEEQSDCFRLTVESAIEPDVETPQIEDQAEKMPLVGKQITISNLGTQLGPYNAEQPIPFVQEISADGILTIGWDRQMTERDDYDELYPARVGVL